MVANPAAGSARFGRLRKSLVSILEADGWAVEVNESRSPGDCAKVAAATPPGIVVCAAGGDGTVNEVVNGLLEAGSTNPVTVFPCGTGNDFAMAIGLPEDPLEAASAYSRGVNRLVDVGSVSWRTQAEYPSSGAGTWNGKRYFCNIVGMGLDAAAARRAIRLKGVFGSLSYTVAVVGTLARWTASRLRIHLVNSRIERLEPQESIDIPRGMLVSICNGPRSGGAFLLTPDAMIDDGLLDVCAVAYPGFLRGLRLLPGVRHGLHVTEPEVSIRRVTEVTCSFEQNQDLHIDGELVGDTVREVLVRVHPQALTVIGGEPR